ncbi:unnamed protein product, partial [Ectocarpus fasciculatus]
MERCTTSHRTSISTRVATQCSGTPGGIRPRGCTARNTRHRLWKSSRRFTSGCW